MPYKKFVPAESMLKTVKESQMQPTILKTVKESQVQPTVLNTACEPGQSTMTCATATKTAKTMEPYKKFRPSKTSAKSKVVKKELSKVKVSKIQLSKKGVPLKTPSTKLTKVASNQPASKKAPLPTPKEDEFPIELRSLSLSGNRTRPSAGKQGEYERLDPEEIEREAKRREMEEKRAKMKSPKVPFPDIDEPVIKDVIMVSAPELEAPMPAEKHSPDRDSHREPPREKWPKLNSLEEDGYELMEWQIQGRKTPYCALKFKDFRPPRKKIRAKRLGQSMRHDPCCFVSIVVIVLLSLALAGLITHIIASGEAASAVFQAKDTEAITVIGECPVGSGIKDDPAIFPASNPRQSKVNRESIGKERLNMHVISRRNTSGRPGWNECV